MPVLDREKVDRLKQILKWHPRGMTISDLAAKMDTNRNLVAKYLDMLLISGQVEMEVVGAAKVYFLSHRVPISSMLEFSSDMVIVLDGEHKIVQINEPVLSTIKEKKDALVGRRLSEIDNPFFKVIPLTLHSKNIDTVHEQAHETECIIEGKKHYFRVKQLPTTLENGNQGTTLIIEDISAQVMYQEMLEINEARYRGIVEDQTEFITRFLPDGKLVFVNDAYSRYLGKNKEDLLGGPHIPNLESGDITAVERSIASLGKSNPVITFECQVHHACGRDRWNLWTVRVLFDDENRPVEYQGIGRDNTEKREAAARINQYIQDMEFLSRKAQEFVELSPEIDIYYAIGEGLFELIPTAVIVIDSYDQASDSLTVRAVFSEIDRKNLFTCLGRDMLGFQFHLGKVPEQLRNLSFSKLGTGKLFQINESLYDICFQQVPQSACDRIAETLQVEDGYYGIGLSRHGIFFGNVTFALRNGETLANASLVETFIHQASVVLHRRLTEESLKVSEKLYRSVIENIQDVFYRSDLNGNLIMASPSWANLLGYDSLEECIGYNIAEKFYFEPDRRKEFLDAVYRNGSVSDYEVVLKCRDGTPLYVSTNSHLYYDGTGSLLGVEGIFRDIRERKISAEKIQNTISRLEFFSKKLQEFIELPPDSDIYHAIGQGLKELLPDSMIIVNNYDWDSGTLTIKALIGDKVQAIAQKYFQCDLTGVSLQVDEPIPENISAGKIYPVQKNFHSIVSQNFSQDVSAAIMHDLNLGDFYYISLVWGGSFLGNVTFGLPKGEMLEKIPFIELYGKAASIVLQRNIAGDSLRESREIFTSVAKYAPVPIAIIEPDGRYQFVNQKFTEIFGYDLHDFKTGKEWFSLAYPDPEYRKKVIVAWKSDLEASISGQQRPETFKVRCKNGVDREIIFRPVTLSDDKQCIVYEDVTELRVAGQVQKLLSSIVETSRDAIISKKTDGTIISWNKAAEQLYGYTRDEMIGRNISIIIPPERQKEMQEIFSGIKNGISANNIETVRVRKDGRIIDVALTISPITNDAGIVIGASTIGRDISVKKSEERMMENEEKYRSLVENMKLGMYRSTGDPKGRFVWGNTSLLEILGYPTFDTLRQIDVADLFAEPGGREKLLADLRQSGFVINREIYLRRAEGRQICVRVTALAKFDQNGDIEFINGTVEDISDYKADSLQLQVLRKELADVIDFIPDPAFIIDKHRRVIAWNSAMEYISGVSRHEVVGGSGFYHIFSANSSQPPLIDLLESPDEEIRNAYPHVKREGNSLVAEAFFPSFFAGQGAHAWMRASTLYDPAGNKTGAIEIIRDISKPGEIKEPGTSVENSGPVPEDKSPVFMDFNHGLTRSGLIDAPGILSPMYLSQALKMAQDYIAILDKTGKCLWANDAMVKALHAKTCSDLEGKSLALFIAPEFRKIALGGLTDVRKNGHKILPLMMLSSSGRIPVEANISAIHAEDGDFFGFIAIARNTDQGKIEKPGVR